MQPGGTGVKREEGRWDSGMHAPVSTTFYLAFRKMISSMSLRVLVYELRT